MVTKQLKSHSRDRGILRRPGGSDQGQVVRTNITQNRYSGPLATGPDHAYSTVHVHTFVHTHILTYMYTYLCAHTHTHTHNHPARPSLILMDVLMQMGSQCILVRKAVPPNSCQPWGCLAAKTHRNKWLPPLAAGAGPGL
jgi:hypothetical protein